MDHFGFGNSQWEKIAAFGSSYAPVGAAEGCDLFKVTYIYQITH
jgi:hypothetical protein